MALLFQDGACDITQPRRSCQPSGAIGSQQACVACIAIEEIDNPQQKPQGFEVLLDNLIHEARGFGPLLVEPPQQEFDVFEVFLQNKKKTKTYINVYD